MATRTREQVRRDRLICSYFKKGYSNNLILCFLSARHGVQISLSTLKRSLKKQKLRRKGSYSSLAYVGECLLVCLVGQRELNNSASLLGYRAMHQRLKHKYGIQVPRSVIAGMLRAVDPVSVKLRAKHRLIRRNYWVKGPSFCWHMDGLDKLKTYGFAIHGCMDGFSRKVLWLEVCTTNNDPFVVAGYFLHAVGRYGCPRIVRTDRGTENCIVAFLQPFLRRNGQDRLAKENSFQYGRSASNQRIEAWWSQLRKSFTDWWIDFFKMLKDNGLFDETDPVHLDCIRFAFMEILQNELNEIRCLWNYHPMVKARNGNIVYGIPDELFYIPDIQGYEDYSCSVDQHDRNFCQQYTASKPSPVPEEFIDLATVLMEENGWLMPQHCQEALELYLNLTATIQ